MDILINVIQTKSFELGDLVYINDEPDAMRIIVTNMDDNYALFNPKTCQITTNWYKTTNSLLSGMSPVLLKKANQIAVTEVIK